MHWYNWLEIYLAGFFVFILWDAFIGWGDWESGDHWDDSQPPAWFVALFWMIAFPSLLAAWLGSKLLKFKHRRRNRQKEKKDRLKKEEEQAYRLRIKEEEELRALEEELFQSPTKNKRS